MTRLLRYRNENPITIHNNKPPENSTFFFLFRKKPWSSFIVILLLLFLAQILFFKKQEDKSRDDWNRSDKGFFFPSFLSLSNVFRVHTIINFDAFRETERTMTQRATKDPIEILKIGERRSAFDEIEPRLSRMDSNEWKEVGSFSVFVNSLRASLFSWNREPANNKSRRIRPA